MSNDTGQMPRMRVDQHRDKRPVDPPSAPSAGDTEASDGSSRSYDTSDPRPWLIGSFIASAVALFVLPIVVGPAGVAFGYVAHRKGHPRGKMAMIIAAVATVAGMLLGFVILNSTGGAAGSA